MTKTTKKTIAAKPVTNQKKSIAFPERFDRLVMWHYIILLIVPFFIYIKTVGFDFINMDDIAIIYNNLDTLMHWKNIGIAFKSDAFLSAHGDYYRPVQTVSFMLDAWISGERTWMYHLSNIIYHLLTIASLYSLLRFLQLKNIVAFTFTLFFAIHPLLTSAVSWVPARGDVLIGLWGILLLLTFGKYIKTNRIIYLLLHAVIYFLAAFTKETAVIFPVLFILYYVLILKEKLYSKKLLPFALIWLSVIVLFLIMRNKVVISLPPDFIFGINPLLSNLVAIPILLAKTFIPVNLSPMPLFENNFIMAGVVILVVLLIMVIKAINKKNWLPALGLIWFFTCVIPPLFFKLFFSNFLLEYYQHRMYLPMIGLVILLAALMNQTLLEKPRGGIIWATLILCAIFIPIASIHSDDFKNSYAYFGRAADLKNAGAAEKLAQEYFNERDFVNAQESINRSLEYSNNSYPLAFYTNGKIEALANKNHAAAEANFTQALLLDTSLIEGYIDRADERIALQNIGGASADLKKAMALDNRNPRIYRVAGKADVTTRNYPEAAANFSKAIALNKYFTEAIADRGFVYYQLKEYEKAIKDCDEVIKQSPTYMSAYYNKGMVYYELKQPDKAIALFDSTLALTNNFYFGYFYRGMAKKQKNDIIGACNDWQESVALGFTMAQDTINRYCNTKK